MVSSCPIKAFRARFGPPPNWRKHVALLCDARPACSAANQETEIPGGATQLSSWSMAKFFSIVKVSRATRIPYNLANGAATTNGPTSGRHLRSAGSVGASKRNGPTQATNRSSRSLAKAAGIGRSAPLEFRIRRNSAHQFWRREWRHFAKSVREESARFAADSRARLLRGAKVWSMLDAGTIARSRRKCQRDSRSAIEGKRISNLSLLGAAKIRAVEKM